MSSKTALAWTGIFAISFIPAFLLLVRGPGNHSSIAFTLGQVAGLVGMTLFALSFVLSTRAKWVEDLFGGLDKLLLAHGVLGATAFAVLLAHPLLLVLKYLPDRAKLAATYLLPGGLISVDLGIFALVGMIILISLTLYSTLSYQKWKVSHEFFGLIFLLAAFHVLLIRGNGSRDYIFAGYYAYAVAVSLIGIGAFTYSFLLRRLLKTKEYRIERVIALGDCFEVQLRPVAGALQCKAGQFMFLQFHNKTTGRESHPFSIAALSEGKVTVIIKKLGDFTSKLDGLRAGDRVTVEGPYGRFHIDEGFAEEVWVAGGIGITPFLALAQEFKDAKSGSIDLYYCVRSPQEYLHLEELKRVAAANKRFKLHSWSTAERGRITLTDIERESAPLAGKRFYMCGPEGLKESLRRGLVERGITEIHDERFAFR